jgi:hypothetical protein
VRGKNPANFGHALQRWLKLSLVVSKSNLADKVAGGFLLGDPIAEPEQRPMAIVTKHPTPRLFFAKGFAAYVSSHVGICPHGGALVEIVKPVAPEFEPLGFEDRYLYGGINRTRHGSSLSRLTGRECGGIEIALLPCRHVGNLGTIGFLIQNVKIEG